MTSKRPYPRPDLVVEENQSDSLVEDTSAESAASLPALSPKTESGGGDGKETTAQKTAWARHWLPSGFHKVGARKFGAILLGLLTLIIVASIAQNCAAMLLHNPKHFQFAESPQDGHYTFGAAVLAVPRFSLSGRHYFESGSFSSSNHPEIQTNTWGVIQTASPKKHPLKEALLPPKMQLLQGAIGPVDEPSRAFSHQIVHPPNCVVDISSLNASIFSLPHVILNHITGGELEIPDGDYVTNHLSIPTIFTHRGAGRVRVFVEDESGIEKGITIDNGEIDSKPANFQIWYNGTGRIRLTGISNLSCVIYAPHADVEIGPDVSFQGAIVCRNAHADGGRMFFDRDLELISDWR